MEEENENSLNDEEIEEVEASIATIDEIKIDVTEEDFADFIADNADTYFRKFRKFSINEPNKFKVTWNWAAFFFTYIWLAYRKVYVWAWVVFMIETAIVATASFSLLIFRIVLGIIGNYLYFRHTRRNIIELKATQKFSDQQELSTALRTKGGVNRWILIIGITLLVINLILSSLATH